MKIAKKNFQKNAKTSGVQKHSIAARNYRVTFYQTLEEVPWLLRLDKPVKPTKTFKKHENKFFKKKSINFQKTWKEVL